MTVLQPERAHNSLQGTQSAGPTPRLPIPRAWGGSELPVSIQGMLTLLSGTPLGIHVLGSMPRSSVAGSQDSHLGHIIMPNRFLAVVTLFSNEDVMHSSEPRSDESGYCSPPSSAFSVAGTTGEGRHLDTETRMFHIYLKNTGALPWVCFPNTQKNRLQWVSPGKQAGNHP